MDQSQTAEDFSAQGIIIKVGDEYPLCISNDNVAYVAVSGCQNTNLAADRAGAISQVFCDLARYRFVPWNTPSVNSLKRFYIAFFKS